MLKNIAVIVLSTALAVACASMRPRQVVRLDASSAEAAESSFRAMLKSSSLGVREKLLVALLILDREGVESDREAMSNLELPMPSIARIRHKVAGMTAEQIIERSYTQPVGSH